MIQQMIYKGTASGYKTVAASSGLDNVGLLRRMEMLCRAPGTVWAKQASPCPIYSRCEVNGGIALGLTVKDPDDDRSRSLSHILYVPHDDCRQLVQSAVQPEHFRTAYQAAVEGNTLPELENGSVLAPLTVRSIQDAAMKLFGSAEVLAKFLTMLQSCGMPVEKRGFSGVCVRLAKLEAEQSLAAYLLMEGLLRIYNGAGLMAVGYRTLWMAPENNVQYPIFFTSPQYMPATDMLGKLRYILVDVEGAKVQTPRQMEITPTGEDMKLAAALLSGDVNSVVAAVNDLHAAKTRRAEQERLERERIERERQEAARREQERLEQERLERERIERERQEAVRREQERLEQERLERERIAAAQRQEAARREQERLEQERLERERLEAQRREAARREQERLEQERLERERIAEERRQRRLRLAQEQEEAMRLEREQRERERQEAIRLEQERKEKERQEREQRERERLEQQRIEREKREQERREKLRLEQERKEKERQEREQRERERLEQQRIEQERAEEARRQKEREALQRQQNAAMQREASKRVRPVERDAQRQMAAGQNLQRQRAQAHESVLDEFWRTVNPTRVLRNNPASLEGDIGEYLYAKARAMGGTKPALLDCTAQLLNEIHRALHDDQGLTDNVYYMLARCAFAAADVMNSILFQYAYDYRAEQCMKALERVYHCVKRENSPAAQMVGSARCLKWEIRLLIFYNEREKSDLMDGVRLLSKLYQQGEAQLKIFQRELTKNTADMIKAARGEHKADMLDYASLALFYAGVEIKPDKRFAPPTQASISPQLADVLKAIDGTKEFKASFGELLENIRK